MAAAIGIRNGAERFDNRMGRRLFAFPDQGESGCLSNRNEPNILGPSRAQKAQYLLTSRAADAVPFR